MTMTTTKTYSIIAGRWDGPLSRLGIRTGHTTVASALAAIARVTPWTVAELVTVEADVLVYSSQASADRDDTGALADAVITTESE